MRSKLEMLQELVRFGVRNVGRNRRRSLITGTMIALAVTGVIFFKAYALGIERVMVNMAVEGLVGAIQLQREGYLQSADLGTLDLDLPEDGGILEKVALNANVQDVAPRLLFTGFLSNGDTSNMFFGLAIDPTKEPAVCPSGPGAKSRSGERAAFNALVAGGPLERSDEEAVLLTDTLARALAVSVGDNLVLLVRTRNGSMDSVDLTVKGLFHYDDPIGNQQFGVVPLLTAQRLLHMKGRVTAIALSVVDRAQLEATAQQLQASLKELTPAVVATPWQLLAPYYNDVAGLQEGMLNIVFFVVLLIVLAGVVNTMMMSTMERKREIGTLMAMGFRRWAINALFIIEALWLSLFGTLAGLVLGIVLVQVARKTGINFAIPAGGTVMTYPELRMASIWVAMVGAFVSALLASLLPAYRASRLQPIEALRSD